MYVDESVSTEQRILNTQKLANLIITCIVRADREKSTELAGKELLAGAEKILKDSEVKDEVTQLLYWEPFTARSVAKKSYHDNFKEKMVASFPWLATTAPKPAADPEIPDW